jgi:hypothetical protein
MKPLEQCLVHTWHCGKHWYNYLKIRKIETLKCPVACPGAHSCFEVRSQLLNMAGQILWIVVCTLPILINFLIICNFNFVSFWWTYCYFPLHRKPFWFFLTAQFSLLKLRNVTRICLAMAILWLFLTSIYLTYLIFFDIMTISRMCTTYFEYVHPSIIFP